MNRAVYQPPKRTQMSYSDLTSLFREAENNRQHLTAHIIFTADTFKKPYSEFERTYEGSSDNKAFQLSLIHIFEKTKKSLQTKLEKLNDQSRKDCLLYTSRCV